MSRLSIGIIAATIVLFSGLIVYSRTNQPKEALLGVKQPDLGRQHVAEGQAHAAYNSSPASSGPHYQDSTAPAAWGVYKSELAPEVYIHNEEHGGVLVTYNPSTLASQDITKLENLAIPPYSNSAFKPKKIIVMPRKENIAKIQIAAWNYTYSLDSYDESKIITFFNQHAGKAPEPLAGPNDPPVTHG